LFSLCWLARWRDGLAFFIRTVIAFGIFALWLILIVSVY